MNRFYCDLSAVQVALRVAMPRYALHIHYYTFSSYMYTHQMLLTDVTVLLYIRNLKMTALPTIHTKNTDQLRLGLWLFEADGRCGQMSVEY